MNTTARGDWLRLEKNPQVGDRVQARLDRGEAYYFANGLLNHINQFGRCRVTWDIPVGTGLVHINKLRKLDS